MLNSLACAAFLLASISSCNPLVKSEYGTRAAALDDAAWDASVWISAVNAPVAPGHIRQSQVHGPVHVGGVSPEIPWMAPA